MSGCVRALGHNTRDEVFLGVGTIEGSQAAPASRAQTNKEAKAEKLVSENQTLVCARRLVYIYIIHTHIHIYVDTHYKHTQARRRQ